MGQFFFEVEVGRIEQMAVPQGPTDLQLGLAHWAAALRRFALELADRADETLCRTKRYVLQCWRRGAPWCNPEVDVHGALHRKIRDWLNLQAIL
jgi:hypothetical protein